MKRFVNLALAVGLVACGGGGAGGDIRTVRLDGSSTVFPISEAVAEEYQAVDPNIRVTVGISGTGGGFKKFLAGETDINDASRTIKESEIAEAEAASVGYIELPVAFDGLSVVVHPDNTWVDHLTVDELRMIWQPGSTVSQWSDVRREWPDRPIALYGPGTDSGTFDYFTEAVNGEAQASRSDFTASEDDNVLVQGVAGDIGSLGFFGYAYYAENQERVKIVPIDGGNGPVVPSPETINDGTYAPLARPIFIYVSTQAAARSEVASFVDFYLENAPSLVSEVGYVPLPEEVYALAAERFARRVSGSAYVGRETRGVPIQDLYRLGD